MNPVTSPKRQRGTKLRLAFNRDFRALLCHFLCGIVSYCLPASCSAAEYAVGPRAQYATPDKVPWERLRAGDVVTITWRSEPYRSKWILCCRGTAASPVTVRGLPGPDGELPVILGKDAVGPLTLDYWGAERCVVKVGGAGFAPDLRPAHIVIENLDISGARPGNYSAGPRGVGSYSDAASPIYVETGDHITVRNCILHDSANGFFTAPETSEILVEDCWIYDNGLEDSIYQHNVYTESAGITFRGNRIGPLRAGCPGNNLKDRSAGLVIAYNWLEGGNRQLDLVDAEDSEAIRGDVRYHSAYVYGNVLIEPDGAGNNQIVHFGGDNGTEDEYRHGPLYFFNNTVVSRRSGTTALLRLSANSISARVFNNVLYVTEPGDSLSILDETGSVRLEHNVLKPGWRNCHGELAGSVRAEHNTEVADPGFVDAKADNFRPRPGSPLIDAGAGTPPKRHPLTHQFQHPRGTTPRSVTNAPDAGAFELDP